MNMFATEADRARFIAGYIDACPTEPKAYASWAGRVLFGIHGFVALFKPDHGDELVDETGVATVARFKAAVTDEVLAAQGQANDALAAALAAGRDK